jgi:cobalt-zinc-cadmium resistance protein CzcA
MGVPGAEQVRSLSKFGLALITIVFEDNTPIYFARQLITERLTDARERLPAGVNPTLGPVATAFGEIYQYLIEGNGVDAMTAKTTHDWEVRTRLRSVKGVSEINSWGGLTKQFHIIVDPRKLEKYGLSLHQLFQQSPITTRTSGRIHRTPPERHTGSPAVARKISVASSSLQKPERQSSSAMWPKYKWRRCRGTAQ